MAPGLMDTYTSSMKTAIEASSSITAPVRIRREIEIDEKRNTAKTFVTIVPGRQELARAESPGSYIMQLTATVRISSVAPTDSKAITDLSALVDAVIAAIYGQSFGGRRFVSTDIDGEFQTDDVTQNLYYYDMEITAEYQVSK